MSPVVPGRAPTAPARRPVAGLRGVGGWRWAPSLVAGVLLGGCAGAPVHDLGQQTYGLVAHDDHSVDQARHQAERRARAYCEERGGVLVTVTSANRATPYTPDLQFARYEVVFQCIGPGQASGGGMAPEEALQRLRQTAR